MFFLERNSNRTILAKRDCEACDNYENELIAIREDLVDTLNTWVVKVEQSNIARLYSPTKEPALVFFRHGVPLLYDGKFEHDVVFLLTYFILCCILCFLLLSLTTVLPRLFLFSLQIPFQYCSKWFFIFFSIYISSHFPFLLHNSFQRLKIHTNVACFCSLKSSFFVYYLLNMQ